MQARSDWGLDETYAVRWTASELLQLTAEVGFGAAVSDDGGRILITPNGQDFTMRCGAIWRLPIRLRTRRSWGR